MLLVKADELKTTLIKLKKSGFKLFLGIVCTQTDKGFELTYILYNIDLKEKKCIRTLTDSHVPNVSSICSVFKGANFDEREIYDLFGVQFIHHPNLKRILLPEGWEGHPLRKDYVEEDARLVWRR